MKKSILIFFLFFTFIGFSQVSPPNLVSTLKHDTCLNKKFSIVFYVILDSNYSVGVATQATLDAVVNNLNNAFKNICVSFMNCSTVVIPNYPYNQWTKNIVEPVVTANWYTDKTINFYIPKTIMGGVANELNSYTYAPPTTSTTPAKDIIVVEANSLLNVNNANTQSHEVLHVMGHFLGLPNTFDEIGAPASPPPPSGVISNEFVNRSNCYTNGDGFCDTEADCYPVNFNSSATPYYTCFFDKIPGLVDGNSQYYVPPVDNLMSNWGCRCKYTQEQYNFMARVILKQRLYLH